MNPLFEAKIGGISEFYEIFLLAILGIISGLVGSIYMKGLTGPFKNSKANSCFLFANYSRCICGVSWYFFTRVIRFRNRYN